MLPVLRTGYAERIIQFLGSLTRGTVCLKLPHVKLATCYIHESRSVSLTQRKGIELFKVSDEVSQGFQPFFEIGAIVTVLGFPTEVCNPFSCLQMLFFALFLDFVNCRTR